MQLAVVAHIRHMYTHYDKLLKNGDWHAARAQVEKATLDKLLTWRRDDDDDPNAMEGILREVIVIPDDDEEDESRNPNFARGAQPDREESVEVMSDHAIEDEVQTRPIEYGTMDVHADPRRLYSPDMDNGEIVGYVRRESPHYQRQIQHGDGRVDRIGVYRNRIWEQALHRRRRDPGSLYPLKHRPTMPEAIRSNQIVFHQNHAEPRPYWPESMPRQPPLLDYVGNAPTREQLQYRALPSDGKPVEIRYITDHSRELPTQQGDGPAQVSETHSIESDISSHRRIDILGPYLDSTKVGQPYRPSQQPTGTIRQKLVDTVKIPYGREANTELLTYPSSQAKQPKIRYPVENQTPEGARPVQRKLDDTIHHTPSPHVSRRHSEKVLPSIECTSRSIRDQPIFLDEYAGQASPSFQNQNVLVKANCPASGILRLHDDWDQPDIKKRRVEGISSFSREEAPLAEAAYAPQRTTLIPLRDEIEYTGYGTSRKSRIEEGQMMPLHRTEATDDLDRRRPSENTHTFDQGASQRRYVVDAEKSKYAPRKHFQIQLSRPGTGQQADLVSKPLHVQPEQRQSFPTSHALHKHVSTSYGPIDPYFSLHYDDNLNARDDRRVGATFVSTVPSRFKEPETMIQPGSRDPEIRHRQNEQFIEEYNDSTMVRRVGYVDSQYGGNNRYITTKPRTDRCEQRQPNYKNARSTLRDLEPQLEAHNQPARSTSQLIPENYHSVIQNPVSARSDERHVVRSPSRSLEPHRYEMHRPIIQLGLRFSHLLDQS